METAFAYPELETFYEEGWISDVLYPIKSGKEATAYCCRAEPRTGYELVAAKVYKSRNNRNFHNDAVYREGRQIGDKRLRRAVEKKTRTGREAQFGMWIGQEVETLKLLHEAGADVPRPLDSTDGAVLMEFIGDEDGPAPMLQKVRLDPAEARPLFERTLRNLELFLQQNRIHGDLSPFNILYHEGRLVIIDFPQAVPADRHPNGLELLQRDVTNVCEYFSRFGLRPDPVRIARVMWGRFWDGEL